MGDAVKWVMYILRLWTLSRWAKCMGGSLLLLTHREVVVDVRGVEDDEARNRTMSEAVKKMMMWCDSTLYAHREARDDHVDDETVETQ